MFAVNAIINRFVILTTAVFLCSSFPVAGLCEARESVRSSVPGSLADQLNKMTQKAAPSSTRANRKGGNGNGITKLDVINIIGADELGDSLRLPSSVFCDQDTGETYVVDAGLISVYGENFFPVASLGNGRGTYTATGVYVDKLGNVYVPQASYYDEPPRITVYNAAFFQTKQIYLDEVPGAQDVNPKSLIISDNGSLYIAFDSGKRGLLVLDKDGNYSHWLTPMDLIFDQNAIVRPAADEEQEEASGEAEDGDYPAIDISELVPQLVPKKGEQIFADENAPGLGPVVVTDVSRDSQGNLYILSAETGKVYIYTPDEEFLYAFGEQGGSTGKLSQPRKLVVDEKKKAIYVVDYNRHAILIYDLSGRFMHEFGGKGNRPGWFQYPASLATNKEGNVVVADMFNRRVQVLDVHFQYKFPLFQVPFVFDPNDIYLPMPIQTSQNIHYGPGFDPGEQASDFKYPEDVESIRDIFDRASQDKRSDEQTEYMKKAEEREYIKRVLDQASVDQETRERTPVKAEPGKEEGVI